METESRDDQEYSEFFVNGMAHQESDRKLLLAEIGGRTDCGLTMKSSENSQWGSINL